MAQLDQQVPLDHAGLLVLKDRRVLLGHKVQLGLQVLKAQLDRQVRPVPLALQARLVQQGLVVLLALEVQQGPRDQLGLQAQLALLAHKVRLAR